MYLDENRATQQFELVELTCARVFLAQLRALPYARAKNMATTEPRQKPSDPTKFELVELTCARVLFAQLRALPYSKAVLFVHDDEAKRTEAVVFIIEGCCSDEEVNLARCQPLPHLAPHPAVR